MAVGEVSAALSAIRQRLAAAAQQTRTVADRLVGQRDGLTRLLHGSSHPRLGAAWSQLDAAVQRLREAAHDVDPGNAAMGVYVATITGGVTDMPSAAAIGSDSVRTTVPAGTRYDAVKVAEMRVHVGRAVAVGRLYGIDGRPLTPLVGPGDIGSARALVEPQRSMRFANHVEANAAAYMRQHQTRQAVLYLNMRPCRGPDGCADNLKGVLPVGYRLVVHQVLPNGSTRVYLFDGTGQGLIDE